MACMDLAYEAGQAESWGSNHCLGNLSYLDVVVVHPLHPLRVHAAVTEHTLPEVPLERVTPLHISHDSHMTTSLEWSLDNQGTGSMLLNEPHSLIVSISLLLVPSLGLCAQLSHHTHIPLVAPPLPPPLRDQGQSPPP